MSVKQNITGIYRRVVPEPIRRFIRGRLTRRGYTGAFFDRLEEMQAAGDDVMAATLVELFAPQSVADVGCGSGGLLAALARRGVPTVVGFESSPAGIARARRRKIDVRSCDLTHPFRFDRRYDLVVSLEVAEHLPEALADQFLDSLTSNRGALVFSAATPGQGGEGHINEQPHQYWIGKFAARGYVLDAETTRRVRAEWSERNVATWYCNNVMFLRRG